MKNSKITHPINKVHFKFENLFNGDENLGNEMNKFMNDNWEDVAKDLNPSFEDTINSILTGIVNSLFTKVPYEELFDI